MKEQSKAFTIFFRITNSLTLTSQINTHLLIKLFNDCGYELFHFLMSVFCFEVNYVSYRKISI